MTTVTVLDDTGTECRVLLRPIYSRRQFVGGHIAIKCAIFKDIEYVPMKWLPVFTEWWEAPDA